MTARAPRLALATLALALAATIAQAQSRFDPPGRGPYGDPERFSGECRPPLKYAAGACVPECPAGYSDQGRVCAFRSMNNGGN